MSKSTKKPLITGTVFKRFLFLTLCACIVCIIIVYGLLTLPVSNYIRDSRKELLHKYSSEISEYVGDVTNLGFNSLTQEEKQLFASSLEAFSSSMQAVITVIDNKGRCVFTTDKELVENESYQISQELLEKFESGSYADHGKLPKSNKVYYVSVSPFYRDGEISGYCIISQTTLWAADYVPSVTIILLSLIIIAVAVVIILSSVFAYNTSRPLKQMAEASRRFAVGDFESRVHVKRKDEIGQLADAFNEMADSLAASEGMRRNFVANVSHELKTPMTTIAGYIDGILDGTIPEREQKYYLGVVSNEIKRLSRLVTSMISLSKIDSGEIVVHKQEFAAMDTIFQVALQFENQIADKNLEIIGLDKDEEIYAYGDKDLIHQVLYNLIENAVKFTPENGYISFDVRKEQNRTYFTVENSGAGILPEDLRLVFDKFYKVDKSRSSHKNSMGLGLYIARTIVLLHEGNITAESEPQKFCRFIFWLEDAPSRRIKEIKNLPKEENHEQRI